MSAYQCPLFAQVRALSEEHSELLAVHLGMTGQELRTRSRNRLWADSELVTRLHDWLSDV
jgi:hypothetical protein